MDQRKKFLEVAGISLDENGRVVLDANTLAIAESNEGLLSAGGWDDNGDPVFFNEWCLGTTNAGDNCVASSNTTCTNKGNCNVTTNGECTNTATCAGATKSGQGTGNTNNYVGCSTSNP